MREEVIEMYLGFIIGVIFLLFLDSEIVRIVRIFRLIRLILFLILIDYCLYLILRWLGEGCMYVYFKNYF